MPNPKTKSGSRLLQQTTRKTMNQHCSFLSTQSLKPQSKAAKPSLTVPHSLDGVHLNISKTKAFLLLPYLVSEAKQ